MATPWAASSAASGSTISSVEPSKNTVVCSTASQSGLMPSSAGISGKIAAPSGTSAGSSSRAMSAPRDGRDDRQLVAVLDRRGQAVQVADVLVVQVEVDEPPHLAVVEDPRLDAGVLRREVVEHRLDRGARHLDDVLALGVLTHRRRDLHFHRHEPSPSGGTNTNPTDPHQYRHH